MRNPADWGRWQSTTRSARSWLGVCLVGSAGCDASVFDIPDDTKEQAVGERPDASLRGSARRDGGARADLPAQLASGQSSAGTNGDSGTSAGASAGQSAAAAAAGAGGVAAAMNAAESAGNAGLGAGHSAAADGGNAAVGGGGAGGLGRAGQGGLPTGPTPATPQLPSCPSAPAPAPGQAASFCYDFEQGTKGPDDGDVYSLWDTPEDPTSAQLTTQEQPPGSSNHVLFAAPPLTGMYPSATLGHDTQPFSRALVELDFWANPTLLNVDKDVDFFRYAADENDFDHVTNLILRRGQAILRTEDGKELSFSELPSASDKTHVSVVLDRSSDCRVQVYFDGMLVVSSDAVACTQPKPGQVGFVEYGLVELDGPVGPISALYDNIALAVE